MQAGNKSNGLDPVEHQVLPVTAFQVVVGNFWAEVVDMVKSNIAGKPLQQLRELHKGTPLHCHGLVIPLFLPGPDHIFILVLYIKEPYTGYCTNIDDGQLDQQKEIQAL